MPGARSTPMAALYAIAVMISAAIAAYGLFLVAISVLASDVGYIASQAVGADAIVFATRI
jgi:hypothetical protein